MLVRAYEELCKIDSAVLPEILQLFNQTAKEVCEGQQMDMDFEKMQSVDLNTYLQMITLKTSVLLAAAMKMGAIIAKASTNDADALYSFGKNIGIAFQIQDDYLDAFGDPEKFGKQPGGDIIANKKTFLTIRTLEVASKAQREQFDELINEADEIKIKGILQLYRDCGADIWANELKETYFQKAMQDLATVSVSSERKEELEKLAYYLLHRDI